MALPKGTVILSSGKAPMQPILVLLQYETTISLLALCSIFPFKIIAGVLAGRSDVEINRTWTL